MNFFSSRNLLILVATLLSFSSAHAVTECAVTPTQIFVGGDATYSINSDVLWINFANGGAAVVQATDPNYKSILALVLTARSLGKTLTVRYAADGLSCTAINPGGVIGVWLNV